MVVMSFIMVMLRVRDVGMFACMMMNPVDKAFLASMCRKSC